MRKFDHDGLLLAEYQGKLFEKSNELKCSTAIYLRRFLHSDLLKKLDTNNPSSLSFDVTEGTNSILEQFGDSEYGKVKYSKNSLFGWGTCIDIFLIQENNLQNSLCNYLIINK